MGMAGEVFEAYGNVTWTAFAILWYIALADAGTHFCWKYEIYYAEIIDRKQFHKSIGFIFLACACYCGL